MTGRIMTGRILTGLVLGACLCSLHLGAIDLSVDPKCDLTGGSVSTAGTVCSTPGEWQTVKFDVSATCLNGCTGEKWQRMSIVASAVGDSCNTCPLFFNCYGCVHRISAQRLDFFSEVTVQNTYGGGLTPEYCKAESKVKASVSCNCPGCGDVSPILISLSDSSYSLTNAAGGVEFDLDGDGVTEHVAWTARNSDEAFLALDRNLDGRIDNGMELFGDHSPQLPSDHPNGWLALAVWDDSLNGGNEDGVIDFRDEIFGELLIWVDKNHNGISEPSELSSLEEGQIESLSLDYGTEEGWVDELGNGFRFPSVIQRSDGSETIAWDVFFADLQ